LDKLIIFERRLQEHKNGKGAEWTRNHLLIEPVHWEIFATRDESIKREHELKTGFGRKWLKENMQIIDYLRRGRQDSVLIVMM